MSTRRRRISVPGVLLCGLLAGLLIWTKLRLITDLPRSAYAERPGQVVAPGAPERTPGSELP